MLPSYKGAGLKGVPVLYDAEGKQWPSLAEMPPATLLERLKQEKAIVFCSFPFYDLSGKDIQPKRFKFEEAEFDLGKGEGKPAK